MCAKLLTLIDSFNDATMKCSGGAPALQAPNQVIRSRKVQKADAVAALNNSWEGMESPSGLSEVRETSSFNIRL